MNIISMFQCIYVYRCDQYRWVSKGVYTINCKNAVLKKRSNHIDNKNSGKKQGDSRFRRWEYWGYNSALHYTGDHSVYESFSHCSSEAQSKPFIRSAPYVKEKVCV